MAYVIKRYRKLYDAQESRYLRSRSWKGSSVPERRSQSATGEDLTSVNELNPAAPGPSR